MVEGFPGFPIGIMEFSIFQGEPGEPTRVSDIMRLLNRQSCWTYSTGPGATLPRPLIARVDGVSTLLFMNRALESLALARQSSTPYSPAPQILACKIALCCRWEKQTIVPRPRPVRLSVV